MSGHMRERVSGWKIAKRKFRDRRNCCLTGPAGFLLKVGQGAQVSSGRWMGRRKLIRYLDIRAEGFSLNQLSRILATAELLRLSP